MVQKYALKEVREGCTPSERQGSLILSCELHSHEDAQHADKLRERQVNDVSEDPVCKLVITAYRGSQQEICQLNRGAASPQKRRK